MEWRLTWQHLATARFSPSLNLPCARCVGKKCGRDGVTIYESKKAQVAMGGLHYVLHLLGSEPSSEAGQRSLARSLTWEPITKLLHTKLGVCGGTDTVSDTILFSFQWRWQASLPLPGAEFVHQHKVDLGRTEEIDRYPTQHVGIHDLHAISKGWESVHKRGFFQKSSSVFHKVSTYLHYILRR